MTRVMKEGQRAAVRNFQQYMSIQVLRGIAAAMVVVYHLPRPLGMLELDIPVLNAGVDLFFVISGFVMVVSTQNRRHDYGGFLMQRFTRIVPFYWVMTFVMAAALWLFTSRAVSLQEMADSLLFIPYRDMVTGFVQPVLGVGWTLNLEILFYILFAVTMALGTWKQLAIVGFVFAVAVVARVIFKPAADTVLFFYTSPILFEFLAGMALGHLAGRLARVPAPLAALAALSGIPVMVLFVLGLNLPRTLAQGLPALVIVAGCVSLEDHFRRFSPRLLASSGDASYSLYLTHSIVMIPAVPIIAAAGVSPWLSGAVLIIVCIAISLATYRFVEKPILAVSRLGLMGRPVKAQALSGQAKPPSAHARR